MPKGRQKGYKRPQAEIDKARMIYSKNLILTRIDLFYGKARLYGLDQKTSL